MLTFITREIFCALCNALISDPRASVPRTELVVAVRLRYHLLSVGTSSFCFRLEETAGSELVNFFTAPPLLQARPHLWGVSVYPGVWGSIYVRSNVDFFSGIQPPNLHLSARAFISCGSPILELAKLLPYSYFSPVVMPVDSGLYGIERHVLWFGGVICHAANLD